MSTSQSRAGEQRRGRRYRQRLPVDLHSQRGAKRLFTHDVGAHGLFLLMNEPPRERHVVKLTIHLPDGPIAAVAHGTHTSNRGMGVQFFALAGESKRRWDAYLSALGGLQDAGALEATASGDATFVVKLKTLDALRDFARHCLEAGGAYLRTPVLKPVGSPVRLAMVHPRSERELPLAGVVTRLHQERPKGIEIQFTRTTLTLQDAFATFVETGVPPEIEVDVDEEAALVVEVREERPAADEDPFDIEVLADDALASLPLEDEHTFDWDDVSEELLVDVGVGDLGTFEPPPTDPNLRFDGRKEPVPPSQEGEPLPAALSDLARPFFQVAVRCDSCEMFETELDVGAPPGALGLVADLRPRFCPSCQTLVTTKQLAPLGRRAAVLATLHERGALELSVPVRLLLETSDLGEPSLCPTCRARLRQTKAVKALEEALQALERGEAPVERELRCGVCKTGRWSVERVEPPVRIEV